MKKETQKKLTVLLSIILLVGILAPAAQAAPVGTSETKTVAAANNWLKVKVIHGGNSRSGIDCSHLVSQVYGTVGAKKIFFMKVADIKKSPYYQKVSTPKPGDLVLWKTKSVVDGKPYRNDGHVGIYIGKGLFIHASNEKRIVMTDSVYKSPYNAGSPYYVRWIRTK